jgi:hypothetical protein
VLLPVPQRLCGHKFDPVQPFDALVAVHLGNDDPRRSPVRAYLLAAPSDPRTRFGGAPHEVKPEIAAVLGRRDQCSSPRAGKAAARAERGRTGQRRRAGRPRRRPPARQAAPALPALSAGRRAHDHSNNQSSTPPPAPAAASFAAASATPRSNNSRAPQPSCCATSARTERPTTIGRDGFVLNACRRQPSAVPPYLTPLWFHAREYRNTSRAVRQTSRKPREDCESDTTPASPFGGTATRVARACN